MTATCPVCHRRQDEGLICHSCTSILEHELYEVPGLLDELDTTLARQGRGEPPGKGGLAHERSGYHAGASIAFGALTNTLTTWARDVSDDTEGEGAHPAAIAAHLLLSEIPAVRRHPAASDLHDEVVSAVRQARNTIDRAANRTIIDVGPCPEVDEHEQPCPGQVFAFIPTEDDRPSRMECKANSVHKWTSVQWLRTGKRILDTIEKRKRDARLRHALYGDETAVRRAISNNDVA